eukprot:CAMPEP_0206415340 /NCGR_PEP_ID=MMETSP0294-20121207/36023_1 /ASSEMBLY_ACC=CAM_ASM_000327 /TAXON_ID=39354 /ORGANISM="Heterosigma akashiwo, Strain CCMP2393" /LENGTH=66 /DNA_ID=CAMNT_0053877645 /DNA_START=452 /DNA_END=652 /DNA_ORIENTATION=+
MATGSKPRAGSGPGSARATQFFLLRLEGRRWGALLSAAAGGSEPLSGTGAGGQQRPPAGAGAAAAS